MQSNQMCFYTTNGQYVCIPRTNNEPPSHPPLCESFANSYFSVCPAGSYSQHCQNMKCGGNIMSGFCTKNDSSLKTIKNYNLTSCQGRDIYFNTYSNILNCE